MEVNLSTERRLHWMHMQKSRWGQWTTVSLPASWFLLSEWISTMATKYWPCSGPERTGDQNSRSESLVNHSTMEFSCKLVISHGSHHHEKLYSQEVRSELCWAFPLECLSLNPWATHPRHSARPYIPGPHNINHLWEFTSSSGDRTLGKMKQKARKRESDQEWLDHAQPKPWPSAK